MNENERAVYAHALLAAAARGDTQMLGDIAEHLRNDLEAAKADVSAFVAEEVAHTSAAFEAMSGWATTGDRDFFSAKLAVESLVE